MTTQLDAFPHVDTPHTAWLRDASGDEGSTTSTTDAALAVDSAQAEHSPILRIRPLTVGDMRPLGKLPGMLRLDVPDSLLQRRGEMLELAAALPVLRHERPTFVAAADSQPIGFVRFSPRGPDGRWVMTAIAASTGVYSPEPVWEALLTHGVRAAGLRGVRRLFARVPVGHPLVESMRRSGWSPYSRETVFRADRIVARSRVIPGLRSQEPADTWAIHQLYAHSVPRQIQEIEALTSQFWHIEQQRRQRRGVRRNGWLLEDGGTLDGYARLSKGTRAGLVDVVVAPGDRRRFGALLDGIAAAPGQPRTIYCAVRAYLLELRDELTDRGFVEVGEQELFIRYTTAAARAPALDPLYFPVELRPALPSQAPTFLEGQPSDGAI